MRTAGTRGRGSVAGPEPRWRGLGVAEASVSGRGQEGRRGRGEGGMVSAELAVALPGLVAVVVMLAWLVSLGFAQGSLVQAAREGARAAARGESALVVRQAVHRIAPGAQVTVRRRADQVVVTAAERREPPLAVLRPLTRELQASATTWREAP